MDAKHFNELCGSVREGMAMLRAAKTSPERRKRIKEKSALLAKQMKREDNDCVGREKMKQD